jgi:OmpA family/Bacterial TSP3 repeat
VKRALLMIAALLLLAAPAQAIDIQNFDAAIGGNNLFTLYQSAPLAPWQFSFGEITSLAGDPLTFDLPNAQEALVVEQMLSNQFYVAFGIAGYVDLGVSASYNNVAGQDLDVAVSPAFSNENELKYWGAGDLRVMLKGRILENKPGWVGLAVVPFAHIPVGDEDYYMGAGAVDAGGLVVLDKRFDRVNIVLNGGYKYKGTSEGFDGEDLIPENQALGGIGLNVYAHRYVDVIAEATGRTVDYNLDSIDPEVPLEVLGGVKLYGGYGLTFTLGAGGGITSGIGSPVYRVLAGFSYTYPKPDRDRPWLAAGPAVNQDSTTEDSDRDGLSNWEESNTWGTDFMNPDSDGDGLKDGDEVNEYKTDPKTSDTDNDLLSDGEEVKLHGSNPRMPDTDGDTLPDGIEVTQLRTSPIKGDTDGDGVADHIDGAPLVAETKNGYQDEDGVPEVTLAKRPSGVIMFEDVIWMPKKIKWSGRNESVISKSAYPMLNDVAVMLNDYPNLKVQIESHVARAGDEFGNKAQTKARADAVRAYLIKQGVAKERMTAVGQGSDFPITGNSTEKGRAINTRTEFQLRI